jgi:hypothetical protein
MACITIHACCGPGTGTAASAGRAAAAHRALRRAAAVESAPGVVFGSGIASAVLLWPHRCCGGAPYPLRRVPFSGARRAPEIEPGRA